MVPYRGRGIAVSDHWEKEAGCTVWCGQQKANPTIQNPVTPTVHIGQVGRTRKRTCRHSSSNSQVCKIPMTPCYPSPLIRSYLSFLCPMLSFYFTPTASGYSPTPKMSPTAFSALFHNHTSLHHRKSVTRNTALFTEHRSNATKLKKIFQTPVCKIVLVCDEVSLIFFTKLEK